MEALWDQEEVKSGCRGLEPPGFPWMGIVVASPGGRPGLGRLSRDADVWFGSQHTPSSSICDIGCHLSAGPQPPAHSGSRS